MSDIDVIFCRHMLGALRAEPTFRSSGKRLMKDAWVYCVGRDHWEFHGPDKFYWHGSAANAYDARYKGWSAWIDQQEEARRPAAADTSCVMAKDNTGD